MGNIIQILLFIVLAYIFMRIVSFKIIRWNEEIFSGNKYWGHNSWLSSCSITVLENEIVVSANLKPDYSIEIGSIIQIKMKSFIRHNVEIKYLNKFGKINKEVFLLNAPNIFYNSIEEKIKKRKLTTVSS